MLYSLLPQQSAAWARRVPDLDDDIGDGVVIELPQFIGKLQPPRTDHAGTFERQKTLVVQVGFKHAAIILRTARNNGLDRAVVVDETVIVAIGSGCIFVAPQLGGAPNCALQK